MCGIVGWLSKNRLVYQLSKHSLEQMEYRGYDSCGIYLKNLSNSESGCKSTCIKTVGTCDKLNNDDALSIENSEYSSYISLCHTRWATHGGVCLKNTHPFINDNVITVHNGIVENASNFILNNIDYQGETDTEIIMHYFSHLIKTLTPSQALNQLNQELEGMFAFVFVIKNDPNKFYYIVKGMTPLYIGVSKNKDLIGICSDANILQKECSNIYKIKENTYNHIAFEDIPEDISVNATSKNALSNTDKIDIFEDEGPSQKLQETSYLRKEINEQSESILKTIQSYDEFKIPDNIDTLCFVGCGSAYNAGLIASKWATINGIKSYSYISSDLDPEKIIHFNPANTLFVLISQSGETLETIEIAAKLKKLGHYIIGIINTLNSSLSHYVNKIIYTKAGREISIASTKAFTSQLAALGALVQNISENKISLIQEIEKAADTLKRISVSEKIINIISETKILYILAKGIISNISHEMALKIKELCQIHTITALSSEFKHGSLALVDSNFIAITLIPSYQDYDRIKANAQEILAREGTIIAITDKKWEHSDENLHIVEVPSLNSVNAPFIFTKFAQELSIAVATKLNLNVDKPRNIVKSVTVI